jgi:hypothetical protein
MVRVLAAAFAAACVATAQAGNVDKENEWRSVGWVGGGELNTCGACGSLAYV